MVVSVVQHVSAPYNKTDFLLNSRIILIILPWYKHTGWQGVKHQVTYLLTILIMIIITVISIAQFLTDGGDQNA